jgi:phage-related minor tail protein
MSDGSVEIRISGSVDPSVAASASEAKAAIGGLGDSTTVSAAAMAKALQATGGNLRQITPEMLGLGAAAKVAAGAQEGLTAATAAETVAAEANTVATEANAAVHINSRAAYEATVLVHEILQGRYSRLTGSSLILTQQLAGQAAVSKVLSSAMSVEGAAVLGVVAAMGVAIGATITYDKAQEHLQDTVAGLGAKSGLSEDQLRQAGEAAAKWADQSVAESTRAAAAFDAAGVRSQADIEKLSGSVQAYAQLTGVKFAEAQKTLAEAMQDPIKGAKDLHDQLGILDGDQIEQIQRLTDLGEKDQAVAILAQALKDRTDELHSAGVGLTGGLGAVVDALSNVWTWLGNVNERISLSIPYFGRLRREAEETQAAQARVIQNQALLNQQSKAGADLYDQTPEGQAAKKRTELIGDMNQLGLALDADTQKYGANSDAVKRDKQALEDYNHALNTYLPEAEKKRRADALDVQIAEARHKHNAQLVKDLTEQKALLSEAGKVESDADAKSLAAGAGDVAGAKTFAPKGGKGPSIVSDWEEQLHEAEVASNDFFSDQTEKELQFWQSKVALTKAGSKDWLDVQSKIYEAQKTLAHRDYDEHVADLNDRLEADRDDFKKFQADWQEKLAYIKSKFGEESSEYRDAHRQEESEERQHREQMLREELSGNSKEIEALKTHLAAMRQERQSDAAAAEAIIRDQADSTVLSEVTAAARIGQVHLQLSQQEIDDATSVFNAQEKLRQKGLADTLATYHEDSDQYRLALQQDKDAYQAFQDQVAEIQHRATAQQIQDILAVKQAYANLIGPTVSATITGLDGMLSKTQNWRQAVIGVYQSVVSTFENAVGRMATKWLVEHVFMTAAQRAQLTIQTAQHTASEVAKTGATTTGVATRAGVENTGFFAKLLGLLGISVGAHTGAETAKTTATVTGATARAATEASTAAASAATQIATNVSLVSSFAGVAGAAGTASWAAAPWPVDAGAPAFGASMSAAALAYLPLASLDVGTNYLPRDMVVQAHEGERVIPKADNRKLMEMMSLANGQGGRGDVHLHYSPAIQNGQAVGLRQLLSSEGGAMITFLNQAVRDGKLKLQPA